METRNVIAAISLSAAVIVLYSLFFLPEPQTNKDNLTDNKKIEQNNDTPSLDKKETIIQISRDEALNQNERIQFENQVLLVQYH